MKRIRLIGFAAVLTAALLAAVAAEAADVQTTMHRIEQRYKDDYRLYPLSEEDVPKLRADPDVLSQMKLAGYYFSKGQYDKSYPIYEKCAKKGDIHALFMQGLSGLNQRGPKPRNKEERMAYIEMINEASEYHPMALYLLAAIFENGYDVPRDKKVAAMLYAEAKKRSVTEDAIVFQAKYDKAMAKAGYGRYGVKDTTGTLALAASYDVPILRPDPLDPQNNPTPELRALFTYLTNEYGTPALVKGKFGAPQDVKTEKTPSGTVTEKYVYKDFTVSFLNGEWVDITVKSGVRVLFNGLKITSKTDDLFAVTGAGDYVDFVGDNVVMHDATKSKAAAEFRTNQMDKVTYMRAYKIVD